MESKFASLRLEATTLTMPGSGSGLLGFLRRDTPDSARSSSDTEKQRMSASKTNSPAGQASAEFPEIVAVESGMVRLMEACAVAVEKSVQHYQGAPAWKIGAMPSCEEMADSLEAQIRSLLSNSQLSLAQIDQISLHLKSASDLSGVARCARHVTQIAWLLRGDATGEKAISAICHVGECSWRVSEAIAMASMAGDREALKYGALLYRQVDEARTESMRFLRSDVALTTLAPPVQRMGIAGVHFMAIAGECMARVAARSLNAR
ncbi:MAG: hypothetical protein OHK0029_30220 [Armatimonadaceae bacterium]